jgi:hypothetical protein
MSEPERRIPERRIFPAKKPGQRHKFLRNRLKKAKEVNRYFFEGISEVFYEQDDYVGEIPIVKESELHVEVDMLRPFNEEHEGQPQIETILGDTRGINHIRCPRGLYMNYIEDTQFLFNYK